LGRDIRPGIILTIIIVTYKVSVLIGESFSISLKIVYYIGFITQGGILLELERVRRGHFM